MRSGRRFILFITQWHEPWRNLASRLPGIRAFIIFAMRHCIIMIILVAGALGGVVGFLFKGFLPRFKSCFLLIQFRTLRKRTIIFPVEIVRCRIESQCKDCLISLIMSYPTIGIE